LQTRQALANERDTIATGSAEKTWSLEGGDRVAVRGSVASGSREYRQLAVGSGYQMGKLEIDYAFVFNVGGITLGDTSGTHRFSMSYRFGPVVVTPKTRLPAKSKKPAAMPEGYEPAIHQKPAETAVPKVMPRAAEITITPEEIDEPSAPAKAAEVSIELIFDTDFDGVTDDIDQCPNTPPGSVVDAKGCAESQVDPHGNPLPRKAEVQFLPLKVGSNGP